MLTAYDYACAGLLDEAGIDIILIGDSLANVVLGLESTKEVEQADMLYHAEAVSRGVKSALVVGDMPFSSYQIDPGRSLEHAQQFINEAGCDAVKIEWFDRCLEAVNPVITAGIPVMGHIGLTPQTAEQLGGYKVQGKDASGARRLIEQAQLLEKAGCFSLVLECVPTLLAQLITQRVSVPTIGIGAGPYCDGQVLVLYDLLGLSRGSKPRFVKQYTDLAANISQAVISFRHEVTEGTFPGVEHGYGMPEAEFKKLQDSL